MSVLHPFCYGFCFDKEDIMIMMKGKKIDGGETQDASMLAR